MQPKIKICGITSVTDAALAERCGADFIGIVCEIDCSPRCISRAAAAELTRQSRLPVILLLDGPAGQIAEIALYVRPYGLQLIGEHSPEDIALIKEQTECSLWLPVRVPGQAQQDYPAAEAAERIASCAGAGADVIILDTMVAGMQGGTGKTCDWDLAAHIVAATRLPVFLAGGIRPENAVEAFARVRPAGIDVSSGVEKAPGVKDAAKLELLVTTVRSLH